MNEYLILIITLSALLIIYTIYIIVNENKDQTEWGKYTKLLKKQKRIIKFKKITLFLMEKFKWK